LGAMLAQLGPGVGIVTGITTITGHRLFDRLQAVDWLYALGLMQAVSELGLPVSTMGNNMLVTREAYFAAGGFENIPFSVTEDVRLFNHVREKGYTSVNMYHPEVLSLSMPAPDVVTLLHQRKRWMQGSMNLPWYMVVILMVHAAYYPIVLPFFFQAGFWAGAGIFLGKLLLQTIYIRRCFDRLRLPVSWLLLLLFEVYQLTLTLVLLVFYFLPIKVNWKGRRY
jgi:cellulose synthase/poly-beta-1,6-N-acetylglucosamine synthase-like glycosyltransferase